MSTQSFYSPQEFATLTGLSIATVHRYRKAGKLPFLQPGGPGGRILIPANALDQFIHAVKVEASPGASTEPAPNTGSVSKVAPRSGPTPRWLRQANA